ncbi:MAG TPA: hypothetical protein VJ646_19525, partial [Candidatus Binatia bacterium]|nr:hypothetical protein [Candidatus Binatia bacterium]
MRNRKKPKLRIDPLQAIASALKTVDGKRLPAVEAALDSRVRRRLASSEATDGRKYDRNFEIVKRAVRNNRRAEAALFAIDESMGGLLEAQGQVSRAVAFAVGLR